MKIRSMLFLAALTCVGAQTFADDAATAPDGPYKLLKSETVGGPGRWDYVLADSDARRLYIPRTDHVSVFDLDTLKPVGEIPDTPGVHGVAIAADAGHGFSSNGKGPSVTMFDTKTLATIKTITVTGKPDGILYEPMTKQVMVFSHADPNVTLINAADGSVAGTIDLGGEPESAVSDGNGHVYDNIESTSEVVTIDPTAKTVTARWKLGEGDGPSGLAFDAKNHRLFSCCGNGKMVILDSDSGKIIATLPIGERVDAATFNPDTNEAFSSNGDATLTVVKENSPNDFAVEQNVATKPGARTCTLDRKSGHVILVTAQLEPAPAATADQPKAKPKMVPDTFMILVVGK